MVTSTELPRVAFLPVLSTYSWPHPTTPGMEPRLEGDRPISHDLLGHGQLFPEGWPGQWSHQGKSPPHLAAPRPVHWGSSWNCWPERQGILAIGLGAHSLTEGPLPWPPHRPQEHLRHLVESKAGPQEEGSGKGTPISGVTVVLTFLSVIFLHFPIFLTLTWIFHVIGTGNVSREKVRSPWAYGEAIGPGLRGGSHSLQARPPSVRPSEGPPHQRGAS